MPGRHEQTEDRKRISMKVRKGYTERGERGDRKTLEKRDEVCTCVGDSKTVN